MKKKQPTLKELSERIVIWDHKAVMPVNEINELLLKHPGSVLNGIDVRGDFHCLCIAPCGTNEERLHKAFAIYDRN